MKLEEWDGGTGVTPYGHRNHLRRDATDESLCGRLLVGGPQWLDLCERCAAIVALIPAGTEIPAPLVRGHIKL